MTRSCVHRDRFPQWSGNASRWPVEIADTTLLVKVTYHLFKLYLWVHHCEPIFPQEIINSYSKPESAPVTDLICNNLNPDIPNVWDLYLIQLIT